MKYRFVSLTILSCISLFPIIASASGSYIGNKECYPCHRDIKKTFLKDSHYNVVLNICEACHGPGQAHKEKADEEENGALMIEGFREGKSSPIKQNNYCLKCHEGGEGMHWRGSVHDLEEITCAGCHLFHKEKKIDGTENCISCHKKKRAQLQRTSHHPLREGKMTCTDCHNPHGGKGPSLIKTATVNEVCFECHDEKRGPVIWEHAPVRENCSTCHDPHGSIYSSLLNTRVPYLCQECHLPTQTSHPNELYDGDDMLSPFMRGKGCLNCHSLIHGSNHPSGAKLTR